MQTNQTLPPKEKKKKLNTKMKKKTLCFIKESADPE